MKQILLYVPSVIVARLELISKAHNAQIVNTVLNVHSNVKRLKQRVNRHTSKSRTLPSATEYIFGL